jgi:7,8-didemethyl-8-hydroxy-5-deazariboflavin synthase CofG subunit
MQSTPELDLARGRFSAAGAATAAILDRALGGHAIDDDEALHLMRLRPDELPGLFAVAGALRDRHKGESVTYSPKAFFPVTNLCLDRCSYCTFRQDPGSPGAWTMLPEDVRRVATRAAALGCIEALMCLGDKPERAFRGYRDTLAVLGHDSTVSYVAACCEIALDEGMLPHTNAGLLSRDEMRALRPLNPSLGLMLESVSPRLRERGGAHYNAPDKDPQLRLRMIREAGELRIPFTTGILLGIGENDAERVASLRAIDELQRDFGHIQEIIVQNFRAKPSTRMAGRAEPESYETARCVAVARLMMPEMNLQVPPNLNPYDTALLLDAGINDWGGISPLTLDYVNPEAPWPQIDSLARACAARGHTLRRRLPVYAEYCGDEFVDPVLRPALARSLARTVAT